MTVHDPLAPRTNQLGALKAAIFDVDGVLLASPHERAWREALNGLADPERFTTAMYQRAVAGKPRLMGARLPLKHLACRMPGGRLPRMRSASRSGLRH